MRCHEVDYEILGSEMQLVEVELDPGETVIAEAGAMTYMEEGIDFETKMGDGSNADEGLMGKLFSAGKRVFTG
ncbi:MAG: AIM24 family protein, partial [Candidatus Thiodiazotropha endolucinida]